MQPKTDSEKEGKDLERTNMKQIHTHAHRMRGLKLWRPESKAPNRRRHRLMGANALFTTPTHRVLRILVCREAILSQSSQARAFVIAPVRSTPLSMDNKLDCSRCTHSRLMLMSLVDAPIECAGRFPQANHHLMPQSAWLPVPGARFSAVPKDRANTNASTQ